MPTAVVAVRYRPVTLARTRPEAAGVYAHVEPRPIMTSEALAVGVGFDGWNAAGWAWVTAGASVTHVPGEPPAVQR